MLILYQSSAYEKVESVSIVINLANSKKDAEKSFESFKKNVTKFLQIEINFSGWLPESKTISNSIIARKPAVIKLSLIRF